MSYQVLARKWRPATFKEMVGQTHVLRALTNALDQNRLHHAYLFTGTRGVGKTTIARLVAKSLNCEQGVSSTPCGQCSACVEIADGRFIDLIEVDAASRTKIEDTRELLENVQYAPTVGRFKVYLIDEVHMLSNSSFNALLKTLEEPPPHVKFLLATTDPQKLPVTVLSRCLQFNLKHMSREHIVQHLHHVLMAESIPTDDASLWAIAEAAQGSMRDALSLTDQAIAFGEGSLKADEVAAMLGTIDLRRVLKLVKALFEKDVDTLMALIAEVDEHAPDYPSLSIELQSTLHRIAIAQAAPAAVDNLKGDRDAVMALAKQVPIEDVHLYYQIAGKARAEMVYAPNERAGFEMALLRMLAFSQSPAVHIESLPMLNAALDVQPVRNAVKPETVESDVEQTPREPSPETSSLTSVSVVDVVKPSVVEDVETQVEKKPTIEHQPLPDEPQVTVAAEVEQAAPLESGTHETTAKEMPFDADAEASDQPQAVSTQELGAAQWPETDIQTDAKFWWQINVHRFGLTGMTKTLFAHSEWQQFDGRVLQVLVSSNYKKIMNASHRDRLLQALSEWLPGCTQLDYEFGAAEKTPQLWLEQQLHAAKQQATTELYNDPFIQQIQALYDAQLETDSVAPNQSPIPTGA